jgi:hypothetical protein
MGLMKDISKLTFFILWFLLFLSSPAYAYLDAGTGSIIMQILLGGLAGLAVVLRLFWRQILKLFRINRAEKKDIKPPTHES